MAPTILPHTIGTHICGRQRCVPIQIEGLQAYRSLQQGEKLRDKIEEQLARLQQMPRLVRSFFRAPSVAYIGDC